LQATVVLSGDIVRLKAVHGQMLSFRACAASCAILAQRRR
jgi:hypothetical protein